MTSRWIFFRMRNVSDKSLTENQNTILCSKTFSPENHAVYEIMWKNIVQPGRPQMTIWRMRIAYWVDSSWNVMAHGDAREGKWRGKLANGVGSQYPSQYLGTWCIQHYYRWCAHLDCQQSTELTPPGRFKWTRPFRTKDEIWFLRLCHHISNAVYQRLHKHTQTLVAPRRLNITSHPHGLSCWI